MIPPSAYLTALRSSTAELVAGLSAESWSDVDMRAPSLLPGWTRGHVLTHVARNADAVGRTVAGALRGEIVLRYPGGPPGRTADIEAGAGRPATELLADVADAAQRLDRIFGAVADRDGWELPCERDTVVRDQVLLRWREVEIHHVDAAGRYTAADWPQEFVDYLLPITLADGRLPDGLQVEVADSVAVSEQAVRAPDRDLLAWSIGRTPVSLRSAPVLAAWR